MIISPGDFFSNGAGTPTILGADAPTINVLNLRPGDYAWNGEQLEWFVVVRDPNGELDIGHAYVKVDEGLEVVCNPAFLPSKCDGLRATGDTEKNVTCTGAQDPACIPNDRNNPTGPGTKLVPINAGDTDPDTDKAFHCLYTVEPTDPDTNVTIKIGVRDASNVLTNSLYAERWRLNPTVSMDVRTSDGLPITFEPGVMPEQYAHSLNRLFIENTAQKVSLWVFIAMTDLFDSNGPSKCPETNKIDVEGSGVNTLTGVYYRARSGTLITQLNGFPGDNPVEGWAHITNPNQNFECSWGSIVTQGLCTGARPLFNSTFLEPGQPAILTGWANNVLVPTGQAEVEFKLFYPKPCIGTYDTGQILIFGKPI
ncbi:MAG: hypothetical protein HYX24_04660 [Candidatus Aenigmarchaeota archaeon]|nr:hypothetical protein [Candidatus Aenigmarchaeota archaeon]